MKFIPQLVLGLVAAGGLAACGQPAEESSGRSGKVVTSGTANIGGPFTLVETTGQAVTEQDLRGKPYLVYFGFTYCPDVCPTSLQRLGAAQEILKDKASDVGFVLISVDPERDTPENLAQYVTANGFPEGLRGFTGTVKQVDAAKAAYKVYATKELMPDSAAEYTINHSDFIYMIDSEGGFLRYFKPDATPQDIAVGIRAELN